MPTRTRVRAKPAATQAADEYDPNAIAAVSSAQRSISSGEERVDPDEVIEDDGPTGESEDDGPTEDYLDPGIPAEDDDNNDVDEQDVDPSSGTQLGKTTAGMTQGQQAAEAELKDYVRRLTNLATEKAEIQQDITELKKEIKGKGYDMKAFDVVFKLLNLDDAAKVKRIEQNQVNHTYAHAVGIDEELL